MLVRCVGGGDTGEELDVSLLRISLFHEHWQGLLHDLDLATLRANSAVAVVPDASIRALSPPAAKLSVSSSTASAAAEAMASRFFWFFFFSSVILTRMLGSCSQCSRGPRGFRAAIHKWQVNML